MKEKLANILHTIHRLNNPWNDGPSEYELLDLISDVAALLEEVIDKLPDKE